MNAGRWMKFQSDAEGDHFYVSTACLHEMHERCRLNCRWCHTCCLCKCHQKQTARDVIVRAANHEFPREACGVILASGAAVQCTNVADDLANNFLIDAAEADYWWATGQVVAVWHSHPSDPAVPSQEDEAMAVPGLETWIYSVTDEDLAIYRPDERGQLRLVRIEGSDEGGT